MGKVFAMNIEREIKITRAVVSTLDGQVLGLYVAVDAEDTLAQHAQAMGLTLRAAWVAKQYGLIEVN